MHYIGVISLTSNSATINVTSEPQQATLAIGESKKFEISGDGFYDMLVKLNGISSNKTNMTISYLHEQISQTPPAETNPQPSLPGTGNAVAPATGGEDGADVPETIGKGTGAGKIVIWVVGIIILAVIIVAIVLMSKIKRR